jgi:predicted ArsR family transcriptional regulator
LRELLAQRRIPVSIESLSQETVMTTHACPYPKLAEKDRSVCTMEELLFSELLGRDVHLASCRLDGGSSCEFHAK